MSRLVLASGSEIRQRLLRQAGLDFQVRNARVDEDAIRQALCAEGALPRDVADTLADQKARKVAAQLPDAMVVGCDQVLDLDGEVLAKADHRIDLRHQLDRLAGRRHTLLSACVIWQNDRPLWRHVGVARLHMRQASAQYLDAYVDRNWNDIRHSVGGYMIEAEGLRLFHKIEGDLFTVMGIPLLELLNWLTARGDIAG